MLPFSVLADVAAMNDKWLQIEGAHRAGVDTPITAHVCSKEDARRAIADVPFPAVLKPAIPDTGERFMDAKLLWVKDAAELPGEYGNGLTFSYTVFQTSVDGAGAPTLSVQVKTVSWNATTRQWDPWTDY